MRILGIDPGSRITGYGLIEINKSRKMNYIASGCIHLPKTPTLPPRLKIIFEAISVIVNKYRPDEFVIEDVFVQKNVASALKLGQARGAAICAGVVNNIPIFEYTARQIKKAVVGTGAADKDQVKHMVKALLGINTDLETDASDALAVAISHSTHNATLEFIQDNGGYRSWKKS